MTVWLFALGAALGSFLNVIAVRYDPDKFVLARHTWSGRSHCAGCGKTLRWFELIPFLSFVLQRGRCRHCRARLSFQYPLTELIAGLIVAFVPARLTFDLFLPGMPLANLLALKALFTLAFLVLFLIALIDWRLQIIPDELTGFVAFLGILAAWLSIPGFSGGSASFLGPYALLFGFRDSLFLSRVLAAVAAGSFLGLLFLITRGRGIGFGDVKLAPALGLLFGWPDIIGIVLAAFVTGSLYGLWAIARRGRSMKSFLAFGPFLGLGALIIYFWGETVIRWYFGAFFPWI
jgi:leader peptidase (prepilin peptidase) / N-methyltransferase